MTQKIIVCLAILVTCAIQAVIEMTDKATSAAPWNFEIYNKSGRGINVSANYEGRMGQIFGAPMRIGSSGKLRTVLTDTTVRLIVNISDISRKFAHQQFWIVPCPAKNVCAKTIFLTYDDNGLRPQTGVWLGTLGVTDSGLSLENNIHPAFILNQTEAIKPKREQKDYYAILGISKNATTSEITRAYRNLALKWHPDKNPAKEAESMFKEIGEAYAILKDPDKRARYDAARR